MQRPGDEIDIWVVEKALGSGGMGSVYRCHNRTASRILAAVKVLDSSIQRHPEAKARFVREAEILYGLDHPNIVKVRNIRTDVDTPYLEMEFVAGRSLEDLLWKGPIPTDEAVEMMAQCAHALAYMHEQGVRHRDIKPSNLLVQHDGVVKIVDFGLAIEVGGDRITQQGMTFGTVSYAPPEWMNPDHLDPTAWDIYALGVVFYEMLTGDMAFPVPEEGSVRQQAMKVMVDKQDHDPLDPGSEFPTALRTLIQEMTHPHMHQRLGSMAQVSSVLAGLRPDGGRSAVTLIYETRAPRPEGRDTIDPTTDAVRRWGPFAAGLLGISGVAALGLAGVVASYAFGPTPAPEPREPEFVAATPPSPRHDVSLRLPLVAENTALHATLGDQEGAFQDGMLVFTRVAAGDHILSVTLGDCARDQQVCWPDGRCPTGCIVAEQPVTVPRDAPPSLPDWTVPMPTVAAPEPAPTKAPKPDPAPAPDPEPEPAPVPHQAGARVTVGQFSSWLASHPEWQRDGTRGAAQGTNYLQDWEGASPPGDASTGSAVTKVSFRAARALCRSKGKDLASLDDTPEVADSLLEWRLGPNADLPAALGQGQRLTTGVPNVMSYTSFRCTR